VKQKKLDSVYMNVALQVATLSHCVRSKVGAVLVKDGNIIAFGYNGTPSGMENSCECKEYATDKEISFIDPVVVNEKWPYKDENGIYKLVTKSETIHAEVNAILKAARTGAAVEGSTLYLTLSPCLDCSKLILQAGIKRVVFLETYRHLDGPNFLKKFISVEKHTDEI
jgi:dCMP deaminase